MNFKQLQYCSAIILSFKAQFLFLSLFFASMNVFGQIVDCPNNNNDEPSYAAPGEQIVNGLPVYLLIDVNGVNSANNDFCIGNSGNEDTDSGCGTFIFTNLDGGQDGCGAQFCFSPRQGCGSALGNTCIFQEDPNNPGTWENLGSLDAANFTDLCIVAPPGVDQYAITICRPGNGPVSVVDVEIIEPPTIELTPANSVCTADLPSSINLLTFEPVSQTGGVWSSPEGGIVTSAEIPVDAIAGDTYTYSYCYDTSVDQGYQCIICDDLTFTVTDDCCQPIVCDDNDCNTEDVFDLALCECIFTPIEAPSCDDQDCTTIDSYDAAICNCVNTPIATPTCIYSQDTQVVEGCSIADIPAPFATAEEVLENLPTDCELIFEVNDFSTGELCSAVVPLQLTRIYTLANDANGNGTIDDGEILQECEQVFVVIDTTAPTFEVTPADITIACLDDTEPSVLPIALDACDEAPVVLYLDVIMLPTCIESYTIERTWTATDACGNELEHVQIITVEACEPPTCDDNDCTTTDSFDAAICNCVNTPIATPTCIYSQDTQVVEGCSIADIPAPFATAEEVLENLPTDCELIFEVNDFSTGELCSAAVPLQLTRIYTLANDANGNGTIDDGEILQECEQVFVVVDSTDPFFTNAPADITVVCGDEPDSFNPIVDDCDPNVMIVFDEVVNEPACIESYTIERTWTATDVCGNESIHQQIITVETCEPPVCDDGNCATIDTFDEAVCDCVYTPVPTPNCIDPQLETEILEGCGVEVVPAAETDISIIFADLPVGCDLLFGNNDFTSSTICNEVVPLSLTRVYYVGIDGDGDGVISEDEILHTCQESYIIYDTTGPVLSATPADLVIACDEVEEFPPMTVTASDECSESTVGFIEEFTGGGCLGGYDIIRTWTATDACGNETVHTQTITVETCEAPSCDDNDCNTADVYNTVTCECENNPIEPGSCDDMDCTTEDVYNTETCECENTPITPPNCDDEDCTTEDVYNTMTCECEHTPITPPSCDDEDCTTEDVYNTTICECEYTPITPPNCDDEDCTTEDVYNTETCECENTPITPPSCDDEDCNTADVYNTVTCECENNPIEPGSCDDEDCTTEDVYNTETCECENTPITPPSCDDEDCTTEDVYNTTTCECEYTPITPPSCDDNDCTTEDTYDVEECVCVNKPIETPNCDDNDCNTADVYNTMTCECENNPIEPGSCDDMDCTTEDVYNTVTCECENTPITPPSCDDNDCTTIDSYDSSNCTCVNEPIDIPSCDDQDECTEDLFDTASCECVNAPIANCGECDPLKIVVEEIVEPSCYGDSDGAIDIDVPCFGGGGNVEVINLAVNRSATQSSTWNGAVAGLAVDGNTNGGWYQANSVSGTNWSVQPWWQVDLGSIHSIDYIEIWGRTDCCQDFLSDYYVFVSDNPFPAGNVTTLLNTSGVSNYYFAGPGATPESTDVFSTGRYVRVMLNGNHLLQLAEVKVFGKSVVGSGGCNFTYDWSDGLPSTQDQSGLAVGTYSVTVTNEDTGCDESLEITIEDSAPMTCYMVEKSPISEYGGSNGVLGAWVDGGTGPFEFNWNNGGDEAILYNLSAGDYQVTITDANGCTCETDHVLTEPEPTIGGGNCENPTNLALNQPATQSSTQIGAEASRGNDGNTDGNFWSTNSVTLTNWTHQPWWEVELQDNCNIDEIYIYNRTDGNEDHFSNFWVLISDSPNPSYGDPGVTAFEHTGIAGTPTIIQVNGTGKYVRIQLQGTAFLAIAEVEVYGCCEGGPSGPTCTEGAYCDDLDACTTDDVYDVDCNCAGTFADEDGDGVCDVEDECPGYDDTLDVNENGTPDGCENNNECTVGASCDDMDNCTTNDVYDEDCNCLGEFADEDQDGVCDAEDQCPGYDDLLDVNENGIADDCETSTGPSETCDVTIQVIGNSIVIDNVNNPINYIKVYDMDGGLVGICNNDCDLTEIYSNLPDGEYLVDIETFSSSWSAICNIEEVIVVGDTEGYCESYGLTIDYEWIDKIQLGTNLNVSGNDNGYGDYTSTIVHSTAGSNVSIELSPGYSSSPVLQYWAVYVDWNNDFDFNDLNEDAATVSGIGSVSTSISVPSNTVNGHHRVRIVMSPVDDLLPCGSINYGEVEDYTINIKGALPLIDEDSEFANPIFLGKQTTGDFTAYPNPATDELFLNLKEFEGLDVTIDISNIFGETKFSYQTDDLDQEIIKIDLNDFRNGMFTVSINSSKRKRQSKQFVIAKTY